MQLWCANVHNAQVFAALCTLRRDNNNLSDYANTRSNDSETYIFTLFSWYGNIRSAFKLGLMIDEVQKTTKISYFQPTQQIQLK